MPAMRMDSLWTKAASCYVLFHRKFSHNRDVIGSDAMHRPPPERCLDDKLAVHEQKSRKAEPDLHTFALA